MPTVGETTKKEPKADKPKAPAKGKKVVVPEREVKHPTFEVVVCMGKEAVTVDQAKVLLGWQTEDDYFAEATKGMDPVEAAKKRSNIRFGKEAMLKDELDNPVRLLNNIRNRPFNDAHARKLAQDILMKKWAGPNGTGGSPNGESRAIGKTGLIVDGQHSLVALVFAGQIWDSLKDNANHHFRRNWPTEPVIDTVIAFGVDEDLATMQTHGLGMPRSFSDVLFCTPGFFDKEGYQDRVALAKICQNAIRFLWDRTGYADRHGFNAYAPSANHTSLMDFLMRHPRVRDAVKHIYGCREKIREWMPLGTAAGLLYLMGCCTSDGTAYRKSDPPQEDSRQKRVKWDKWDAAKAFWKGLDIDYPSSEEDVRTILDALAGLAHPGGGGTAREKTAVLIHAWNLQCAREALTPQNLKLRFTYKGEARTIVNPPDLGGLDLGGSNRKENKDEETGDPTAESGDEGEQTLEDLETPPEPDEEVIEQVEQAKKAVLNGRTKGPVATVADTPAAEKEARAKLAERAKALNEKVRAKRANGGKARATASSVPAPPEDQPETDEEAIARLNAAAVEAEVEDTGGNASRD